LFKGFIITRTENKKIIPAGLGNLYRIRYQIYTVVIVRLLFDQVLTRLFVSSSCVIRIIRIRPVLAGEKEIQQKADENEYNQFELWVHDWLF
jgi:hypothetical protein